MLRIQERGAATSSWPAAELPVFGRGPYGLATPREARLAHRAVNLRRGKRAALHLPHLSAASAAEAMPDPS